MAGTARKFILHFSRAPGDVLMLTALVRDLKLTYRDMQVDVRTRFPDLWRHNPHLTPLTAGPGVESLNFAASGRAAADLSAVLESQRGVRRHYVGAFHKAFERATGLPVPLLKPHADVHLTEQEKTSPLVPGRYWMIVPGGKTDMTAKWWSQKRYQQVADRLHEHGITLLQDGATKPFHVHPPLVGVRNAVGQTNIRDLMVNLHHADGVICGCTLQMHLAAALQRPAVVILGGREEPWFEAYTNEYDNFGEASSPVAVPHRVLHTFGQLACCETRGCWRCRVVPLHDRHKNDSSLCHLPTTDGDQPVATCMDMISVDAVVDAVLSYYEQGSLPPRDRPQPVAVTDVVGSPVAMPPLTAFLRPTELQKHGAAGQPPRTTIPYGRDYPRIPPDATPALAAKIVRRQQPALLLMLHGDRIHRHRRLINSVLRTADMAGADVRIVFSAVPNESVRLASVLPVRKTYSASRPSGKPAMLANVLNDKRQPIDHDWLVVLDDEAFPKRPGWLDALRDAIAGQSPVSQLGLIGHRLRYELTSVDGRDPRRWFREASWFRNRSFVDRQGREAPNGGCIDFVSPNCFAVCLPAWRRAGGVDPRLTQHGLGVTLGAQMHQHGLKIKSYNETQLLVGLPSEDPTGKTYPWF